VTPPPPRAPVALLAVGAGLAVAGLYYNQPILGAIAHDLGATPTAIGVVPMLTQLGYGAGILLFAPLGDRLDRRRVIVAKALALAVALIIGGLAASVTQLAIASVAIGLCATTAQDCVPAAAALARPETRGKTVGQVMTGLLLGILLSRLVSGAVAEQLGWRAVFFGAAATVVGFAAIAAARLPPFPPTTTAGYGALLRSIGHLARAEPTLRRAAVTQGLLSVAFSAFWSTLALALAAPPFGLGSTAAGAFGLAGAAGALIAPFAGAIADRRGPVLVLRLGIAVVLASFLALLAAPGSLPLLIAATVTFDLGVQACLISHQSIVYGLDPAARSRLNAVLVSAMFVGMATGAALGSRALAYAGWPGVLTLAAIATGLAMVVRLLPERRG
jgi:predicted MFS family arabinose efflux permease